MVLWFNIKMRGMVMRYYFVPFVLYIWWERWYLCHVYGRNAGIYVLHTEQTLVFMSCIRKKRWYLCLAYGTNAGIYVLHTEETLVFMSCIWKKHWYLYLAYGREDTSIWTESQRSKGFNFYTTSSKWCIIDPENAERILKFGKESQCSGSSICSRVRIMVAIVLAWL